MSTAHAVKTPCGIILTHTVRMWPYESRREATDSNNPWKKLQRKGYRVVPVKIVEITEETK